MIPHSYYLFLDTETSHKPEHWDRPDEEYWPYIVQAAWAIYNEKGKLVKEENFLVKADDYHISPAAERIHGISEDEVNKRGVDRKAMLRKMASDVRQYKPLIIGHFIELDLHMVKMSTRRAGMKNFLKGRQVFCTMKATSDYIHLPHRHYPQLSEIYQMLFRKKLSGAHNARTDAHATAEVFFELLRRGDINGEVISRQQIAAGEKSTKSGGCGLILLILITGLLLIQLWP